VCVSACMQRAGIAVSMMCVCACKGACRFVASGERILSIHITHPTATALTCNSSISNSSSSSSSDVQCAATTTAGACGLYATLVPVLGG
jgi:hypothetical protein